MANEKYKISKYQTYLDTNRLPVLRESSTYEYHMRNANSSKDIVNLVNHCLELQHLAEEEVIMIALRTNGDVLGIFEVSHGTVNGSFAEPREIFMRLLLIGASQFVLVHNHPSGSITPSNADFDVYHRIKDAANLMGISLVDFIIIGENNYLSFTEQRY